MQLIIASRNVHKIRELRSMLKPYKKFDVLSLLDFPNYQPLPENHESLEKNAAQKAVHAATTLNQWTIADDTGLIVPALQGAPGVRSARYAGPQATDADNRKKLLHDMKHLQDPDRQAYFECWLAIASPDGLKKYARGICEGTIVAEEKGGKGFGYDSLFVKYEYGKTFAELEEALKNRISHRRKALDKLHLYLESLTNALLDRRI
jgi:XTP/dITP diphosphohydrolase